MFLTISSWAKSSVLQIGREHCGVTRAESYICSFPPPPAITRVACPTITRVARNRDRVDVCSVHRSNCTPFASKMMRSRASKKGSRNENPPKILVFQSQGYFPILLFPPPSKLQTDQTDQPLPLGLVCCVLCCVRMRHCITSCSDSSRWTRQEGIKANKPHHCCSFKRPSIRLR